MQIDAVFAGVIYGLFIGLCCWILSILLRTLTWQPWILKALLILLSALLLMRSPTPFKIASVTGWFEITNPGHVGLNLVVAYMAVGVTCIVGVVVAFFRKINAR